jgi:hypothetical protein
VGASSSRGKEKIIKLISTSLIHASRIIRVRANIWVDGNDDGVDDDDDDDGVDEDGNDDGVDEDGSDDEDDDDIWFVHVVDHVVCSL